VQLGVAPLWCFDKQMCDPHSEGQRTKGKMSIVVGHRQKLRTIA